MGLKKSGQIQIMAEWAVQQVGPRHGSWSVTMKRGMKGSIIDFVEKIEAVVEDMVMEGVYVTSRSDSVVWNIGCSRTQETRVGPRWDLSESQQQ